MLLDSNNITLRIHATVKLIKFLIFIYNKKNKKKKIEGLGPDFKIHLSLENLGKIPL